MKLSKKTILSLWLGSCLLVGPIGASAANIEGVRKKMNQMLDQVEADINKLESDAKQLKTKTSDEWQKMMRDLKKHRDELRADIRSLKEETGEKVDTWQTKIESAMAELKAGVRRATEELKK